MLDLGPRARVVFAIGYIAAQLALVVLGLRAPDQVFAFQMFNESSRIEFELYRKLRGKQRLVPVVADSWKARDRQGAQHVFHWNDRVHYHGIAQSGVSMHAARGLETQLFILQHALDDVSAHTPLDAQTSALIALVHASKNGRALGEIRLSGTWP